MRGDDPPRHFEHEKRADEIVPEKHRLNSCGEVEMRRIEKRKASSAADIDLDEVLAGGTLMLKERREQYDCAMRGFASFHEFEWQLMTENVRKAVGPNV